MKVIRWIKRLGEGVYEVWYDDNTKAVHRASPEIMKIAKKIANA